MNSPHQICAACGGPPGRTSSCAAPPGLETLAAAYDDLVLDDLDWLDVDLPTTCWECHVDADQPHHVGCPMVRCAVHRGPRGECPCDGEWLAEAARIPWHQRIRWPQLRRPRWRRRRFRSGEEIVRGVADALHNERTAP